MEIKSLLGTSIDEIFEARNDAFKNYVRSWTKDEFVRMLHRRGYEPELSFGAFDSGRLVSFTLNGTGYFNDLKTAYDTSTGTIEAYRGQGLASKIFAASLPYLVNAGIAQYLLEVLQDNEPAIAIYKNAGFAISREFNYFIQDVDTLHLGTKSLPPGYSVSDTTLNKSKNLIAMWDFAPSWQNSLEAIGRKPEDFKVTGVFHGPELVGYGVIEPTSGDIPQLAIAGNHRRQGLASCIFRELLKNNGTPTIRIINTDINCSSVTSFLENNGIISSGSQFEMIKYL